jgi:hypothetical protein
MCIQPGDCLCVCRFASYLRVCLAKGRLESAGALEFCRRGVLAKLREDRSDFLTNR